MPDENDKPKDEGKDNGPANQSDEFDWRKLAREKAKPGEVRPLGKLRENGDEKK